MSSGAGTGSLASCASQAGPCGGSDLQGGCACLSVGMAGQSEAGSVFLVLCASVSPPRLSGLPHGVIYRLALKPGWNGGSDMVRILSPRRLASGLAPAISLTHWNQCPHFGCLPGWAKWHCQNSPWLVAPPAPNNSPVTQMYPEVLVSSPRQGHLQSVPLKVPWAPTRPCPCLCLPVTLKKSLPLSFPALTLAAL